MLHHVKSNWVKDKMTSQKETISICECLELCRWCFKQLPLKAKGTKGRARKTCSQSHRLLVHRWPGLDAESNRCLWERDWVFDSASRMERRYRKSEKDYLVQAIKGGIPIPHISTSVSKVIRRNMS